MFADTVDKPQKDYSKENVDKQLQESIAKIKSGLRVVRDGRPFPNIINLLGSGLVLGALYLIFRD